MRLYLCVYSFNCLLKQQYGGNFSSSHVSYLDLRELDEAESPFPDSKGDLSG